MAAFSYRCYHPFTLNPVIKASFETLEIEEMSSGSTVEGEPYDSGRGISILKSQPPMEKRRRNSRDGTSFNSTQAKGKKENRSRKQRKSRSGQRETEEMREAKASQEEPPSGYIHVRARRGQATDSHSLAERVRREKISERMKLLQGLVPGCEKVVGKALMLDEIINYVQSLQNQVEFLSVKLACLNPMPYNFGIDFDGQMNQREESQTLPSSVGQTSTHIHHQPLLAHEDTSTDYSGMDASLPLLLPAQGQIGFSQDNNGGFLMQVGDKRQGFLNQVVLNSNLSSFLQ